VLKEQGSLPQDFWSDLINMQIRLAPPMMNLNSIAGNKKLKTQLVLVMLDPQLKNFKKIGAQLLIK